MSMSACSSSPIRAQHIKAGTLRALAVLGPKRAPAVPDVPTIVEAGLPDVQGITFNGLFAPKDTPPAVVEKLSAAIRAALEKKDGGRQARRRSAPRRAAARPQEFTKFLDATKPRNGPTSCRKPTSRCRSEQSP